MLNKTGPKPCILTAWKCYGGSSVPWKNTPATMRFPHGWTTIIIETGKSKREKGTPPQRFLFNVTTCLCHWHRAWRGLCGLRECWWERQCQRRWPSCTAQSNSSATVWDFVCVCVCVVSLCNSIYKFARVFACMCKCVNVHVSSAVCMSSSLKYTNTCFWVLDNTG